MELWGSSCGGDVETVLLDQDRIPDPKLDLGSCGIWDQQSGGCGFVQIYTHQVCGSNFLWIHLIYADSS